MVLPTWRVLVGTLQNYTGTLNHPYSDHPKWLSPCGLGFCSFWDMSVHRVLGRLYCRTLRWGDTHQGDLEEDAPELRAKYGLSGPRKYRKILTCLEGPGT